MMYATLAGYATVNKNVSSLRLKTEVSVIVFTSIGREFYVRGPATENARSPSLRCDDCRT